MTAIERCEAVKEMLEPDGWTVHWNKRDSQREPGFGIYCRHEERGARLHCSSMDSLDVAVARMENALISLAKLKSHAYMVEPHLEMGKV